MDLKGLEKQINININPKNIRKNKKKFKQEMELWNLVRAGYSKDSIFLISFMDLGSSFIMDRLFIKVDLIKDIFMAMENCKGTFSLII
jgi:hypothetical protein